MESVTSLTHRRCWGTMWKLLRIHTLHPPWDLPKGLEEVLRVEILPFPIQKCKTDSARVRINIISSTQRFRCYEPSIFSLYKCWLKSSTPKDCTNAIHPLEMDTSLFQYMNMSSRYRYPYHLCKIIHNILNSILWIICVKIVLELFTCLKYWIVLFKIIWLKKIMISIDILLTKSLYEFI